MLDSSSAKTAPTILVVDDDAEVLRLLQSGLSSRGYRVVTAANGQEGLDRVRDEVPRLIVLDYWMPVLDGPGFMAGLREMLPKRPPVILFTAVQNRPEAVRALGVDVYVEKPVQMSRLVKLIEATLRAAPVLARPASDGSERRLRERIAFRRTAEVRIGGTVRYSPGFTVDLSEGGLCLESDCLVPPPPIEAHVGVVVATSDGKRIELDGVVRHARPGRVGVQFLPLDHARAAALKSLLAEARA